MIKNERKSLYSLSIVTFLNYAARGTLGLVASATSQWFLGTTIIIRDSLDTPSASLLSEASPKRGLGNS
jgi:hypothetical protein